MAREAREALESGEDGMEARRLARILGYGTLVLLLVGCVKLEMDLEVSPGNTVSGTAIAAVDESLLQTTGQSVDEIFGPSDVPAGVSVDAYEEDGFVGQQITFEGLTLEEWQTDTTLSDSGLGEDLSLVRQGDEFHVTGGVDMSGEQFTGGTEVPQQFLDSVEVRISITFPGAVKSATGTIDGNTVTWEPKVGENTRVEAVASAIPSTSSPLPMILLIAAGALVLGAIAFLLINRKTPAPAAGPINGGTAMPIDTLPSAMAGGPIEPVIPVDPPPAAGPPPAKPVASVEPAPDLPEPPGSAIPPDNTPPPPTSA